MLALEPKAKIASSAKSSWPHLVEKTVMSRIDDLKKNPNLIKQGALGLCGEAAFYHHILQRRPILFASMAKLLFMEGIGFIGDLVIKPDDDLLEANYTQIANTSPGIPPQTDWMVLSALRDTENEYLDFQGTPEEDWSDSSDIAERFWWYRKSKLYTNVRLDIDTDLTHVMGSLLKTPNNHIALRIEERMLQNGPGRHVISLESPLVFNLASGGTVTFKYWTWGNAIASITLALPHFQQTYLGAVIAEF
jgi:hypothetical protein